MGLVTKNNVRRFLKENKKRVATATYDALDKNIGELLREACKRAEANGRNTVMPQDL